MGAQGGPLGRQVTVDADPMGDLGTRGPCLIEGGRIEVCRSEAEPGCSMHGGGDGLARQGRFEEPWRSGGQSRRPAGGVMDLHVVRVAVATAGVVADEHVHPLVVEDAGDLTGNLVDVGVSESVPMLAVEPGIGVAELLESMNAKDVGGLGELGLSHEPEVRQVLGRGESGPAIGGDDEDDPQALGGSPGHRARGQQRLVVGMGMDEGDGLITPACVRRHVRIVLHEGVR